MSASSSERAVEYVVTCPQCGYHTITQWSDIPPGGVSPCVCSNSDCENTILSETEGEPVKLSEWPSTQTIAPEAGTVSGQPYRLDGKLLVGPGIIRGDWSFSDPMIAETALAAANLAYGAASKVQPVSAGPGAVREGGAMEHDLKCWPEYFDMVFSGEKTFEWRKDDRPFKPGDTLLLREYVPMFDMDDDEGKELVIGKYTGRSVRRRVTYILRGGFGMPAGYCVLGLDHDAELDAAVLGEREAILEFIAGYRKERGEANDQGDIVLFMVEQTIRARHGREMT